jgi:hypothetical protein
VPFTTRNSTRYHVVFEITAESNRTVPAVFCTRNFPVVNTDTYAAVVVALRI